MTRRARKLIDQVLQLSVQEQAAVAHEILLSMDGPPDDDAEEAWAKEVKRRAAEADRPDWQGDAWEVVRARVERKVRGK